MTRSTSVPHTGTAIAVLGAAAALLLAALVVAPQANAATIYTCVKKKSGSIRVVAKRTKCRRGETKLSWNSEGPVGRKGFSGLNGKNGKNGTNGSNGANGAAAGFFVSQVGSLNITAGPGTVMSDTLPPGSYIISAKVETSVHATALAGVVGTKCELSAPGATTDSSLWTSPLVELSAGSFSAASTLPLMTAVTTSSSVAATVKCEKSLNTATGTEFTALNGQLTAIQVSSIT